MFKTHRLILWAPPNDNNGGGEKDPSETEEDVEDEVDAEEEDGEEYETEFEAELAKNHPELLDKYREATGGLVSALQKERRGNKEGKDARKKVKEYEAKDEAAAREQRTKEENLQADLDAANARAAKAEAEAKKLKDEQVVTKIAGDLKFQTPSDALLYLNMGSVERDDEGKVVAGSVEKQLKAVLKDKPYLSVSEKDLGPGNLTAEEKLRELQKDPKKQKTYKKDQPKITI